jgi:imidazoleglycerol-phosphate dehydratase / histidinol-phosphatase
MNQRRVIFIDRDGTILKEPADEQVDSLDKLEFVPGVIRNLYQVRQKLDFDLVMVTNQDGLGTKSFPEETFWPAQNKMLATLKNEGVEFDDILIDKSFPHENAPTRKPRTGLLKKYLEGNYNLKDSYVIGDRVTDIELAKNIGAKGILIGKPEMLNKIKENNLVDYCKLVTNSWDKIFEYLISGERLASIERYTKETRVSIELNLDGTGRSNVSTGLGFFDHMLEQIGKHAGVDITVKVDGDLKVDEHHTIEDTALVLGECIYVALGNKRGIERYGYALPMDDCKATVLLDFGGRPWLVWNADFKREKIGEMPTEMFYHFFKSFADAAKCNLHIEAEGQNEHHKIEGIFKAFAKAIKMAIRKDVFNYELPSTKGVL